MWRSGLDVDSALRVPLALQLSLLFQASEKPARLIYRQCAQVGCLCSGNRAMGVNVLKDHLLLLQRLKAMYTNVACGRV
jgi:hypothetical protein